MNFRERLPLRTINTVLICIPIKASLSIPQFNQFGSSGVRRLELWYPKNGDGLDPSRSLSNRLLNLRDLSIREFREKCSLTF